MSSLSSPPPVMAATVLTKGKAGRRNEFIYLFILRERIGWRDVQTGYKPFFWCTVDLGSILGIIYGPPGMAGVIPEHSSKCKSKRNVQLKYPSGCEYINKMGIYKQISIKREMYKLDYCSKIKKNLIHMTVWKGLRNTAKQKRLEGKIT